MSAFHTQERLTGDDAACIQCCLGFDLTEISSVVFERDERGPVEISCKQVMFTCSVTHRDASNVNLSCKKLVVCVSFCCKVI